MVPLVDLVSPSPKVLVVLFKPHLTLEEVRDNTPNWFNIGWDLVQHQSFSHYENTKPFLVVVICILKILFVHFVNILDDIQGVFKVMGVGSNHMDIGPV